MTKLRTDALAICNAAIKAADPANGIRRAVSVDDGTVVIDSRRYSPDNIDRVVVVGAGKASARMGHALESILGNRIETGWINTKYDHAEPLDRIHVHECGHPIPDGNGVEGVVRIRRLLEEADERTLVISLVSGGGSALAPAPVDGITLAEKQVVTGLLLKAGAAIGELNAVRKHLSFLKGGGMARLVYPAKLHLLILSDVIGDPLDTIASGPAVADSSTFDDCVEICRRYGVYNDLPEAVRNRFEHGAKKEIPETAKPGDAFLASVATTLVGTNRISVDAAARHAGSLGYNTLVLTTTLDGEASQAGTFLGALASEIHAANRPVTAPGCVIAGGETTVTVRGDGKGGRNQEMALAAALRISGMDDTVFLSCGTDGTDGPTDAAGGIVDGDTLVKGAGLGLDALDYLTRNDSYRYLERVGGLIKTGPTGTNVMDIQLLLAGKKEG